jgi:hypothetical protein
MLVIFAILPSICVYVCTHIDMLLLKLLHNIETASLYTSD